MHRGSVLVILTMLFSFSAQAERACWVTFAKGEYLSLHAEGMEIRTYRHRLPQGMGLENNPNFVLNRQGELVSGQSERLIVTADKNPEVNGAKLSAPEGYLWQLAVQEVSNSRWYYRLVNLEIAGEGKEKPGRVIQFDERRAHDKDLFSGEFPLDQGQRIIRDMGLEWAKGELITEVGIHHPGMREGPYGTGKQILHKSIAVQNSNGHYLVIFRHQDNYVIGVGDVAKNAIEAAEVMARYYDEPTMTDGLRDRTLPIALQLFYKIQVSERQITEHLEGLGELQPVPFKDNQSGLLLTFGQVSAADGPTVRTVLKAFSELR